MRLDDFNVSSIKTAIYTTRWIHKGIKLSQKPFPAQDFIETNNLFAFWGEKKSFLKSYFIPCVQTSNTVRVKNHTQLN